MIREESLGDCGRWGSRHKCWEMGEHKEKKRAIVEAGEARTNGGK